MTISYEHSQTVHSVSGPRTALPALLAGHKITSLLDVGCGTGTWLKAAFECGIQDVIGLDGVVIPLAQLHFSADKFFRTDLAEPWNLGRCFDAALCLEVAEHLDAADAPALIDALVKHSNLIFFSAACPGQFGQHHVNCQWPVYWQQLFNARGFSCSDELRWKIWDDSRIEPWYRQNLFLARRAPAIAGHEPRIRPVLHPELVGLIASDVDLTIRPQHLKRVEHGCMPGRWYLSVPFKAICHKLRRKFSRKNAQPASE